MKCANIECGVEFRPNPARNQKYCSIKCGEHSYNKSHYNYQPKKQTQKTCIGCGDSFIPFRRDVMYCSTKCNLISKRNDIKRRNKKWRKANEEILKKYAKLYRERNREDIINKARIRYKENPKKGEGWRLANIKRIKKLRKQWEKNNREKVRQMVRQWKRKAINELSDSYVKIVLSLSGIESPSKEIIEQKRLQLKIKRLTNEKQRIINASGSNGRAV